jgi:hypothetical protein
MVGNIFSGSKILMSLQKQADPSSISSSLGAPTGLGNLIKMQLAGDPGFAFFAQINKATTVTIEPVAESEGSVEASSSVGSSSATSSSYVAGE